MNAAEFKTLRQCLGLTTAQATAFFALKSERTVRHWEQDRNAVPEGAAAELAALDRAVDDAARILAARVRASGGPLLRYRSDEDFHRAEPTAAAELLGARTHAVAVDRARRILEAEGRTVRIEYAAIT